MVPSEASAKEGVLFWGAMHYAYILESLSHPGQRYIGHTSDLRKRLEEHNSGKSAHTSKHIPWKVKTYIAFESIERAIEFEEYLKTGSGKAFAGKRLL